MKFNELDIKFKPLIFIIRVNQAISYFLETRSFKGFYFISKVYNKLFSICPTGLIICPTRYSFKMLINPAIDKGVELSIFRTGTYEAGTLFLMRKILRNGDIFIDVGSNVGLMSLFAAKLVGEKGQVFAFEPNPEIFSLLQQNIQLNNFKNISAINYALGSASCISLLYENIEINRGASSLRKTNQNLKEGIKVKVCTLDKFIHSNKIQNIRLIKIDVEGWELEVLKGAGNILQRVDAPIICFESNIFYESKNHNIKDILDYLFSINNYQKYKLLKGKGIPSRLIKIEHDNHIPTADNIFCFLPIHLETIPKDLLDNLL